MRVSYSAVPQLVGYRRVDNLRLYIQETIEPVRAQGKLARCTEQGYGRHQKTARVLCTSRTSENLESSWAEDQSLRTVKCAETSHLHDRRDRLAAKHAAAPARLAHVRRLWPQCSCSWCPDRRAGRGPATNWPR